MHWRALQASLKTPPEGRPAGVVPILKGCGVWLGSAGHRFLGIAVRVGPQALRPAPRSQWGGACDGRPCARGGRTTTSGAGARGPCASRRCRGLCRARQCTRRRRNFGAARRLVGAGRTGREGAVPHTEDVRKCPRRISQAPATFQPPSPTPQPPSGTPQAPQALPPPPHRRSTAGGHSLILKIKTLSMFLRKGLLPPRKCRVLTPAGIQKAVHAHGQTSR